MSAEVGTGESVRTYGRVGIAREHPRALARVGAWICGGGWDTGHSRDANCFVCGVCVLKVHCQCGADLRKVKECSYMYWECSAPDCTKVYHRKAIQPDTKKPAKARA